MDSNELKIRLNKFAHNAVRLCEKLPNSFLGNHIAGQLIRCSTSAAANYRAALLGQSKASFISKISIVLEEIDESNFWIQFAYEEQLLKKEEILNEYKESAELTSIFAQTRKSARENKNKQ